MAADYLSDREQEEALLQWWKENWAWVIGGIALGLVLILGYQFYKRHQAAQAESAAQVYSDVTTALSSTPADASKAEGLVKRLDEEFGSTPYAAQGHMLMAQHKVNAGQYDQAGNELKAVIERAGDPDLVQVARLRLARVQLQLGRPDEAIASLEATKAGAFAGQVHDIRGDALLAKGDRPGAKAAYEAAMTEFSGKDPQLGEFTRLKLQDLADVAAPAPAAAEPAPPAAAKAAE